MTIYNFTEMTRNIGTFTAAGVDLDTSVKAIKGIANLAAVSGSNSQQASTAMYQLSQALAAGTVKLQDWNSVVNAGMGGQVFQDALKETARVHGIAIDQMITDEGSFRETLQKGWLTSDILTETLAKFTGDLNEDQLRTMGYSEEQIKSIIKMGQTANDAATKVKTFTQLFDTLKEAAQSGWTQSLEILANVMAKFGGMQWDEIGRGLTVLGGALAELAIGLNVMKGTLSGSAAMIVAATALAILTPVLTTLGNQSWEEIVKGLVTLAGAFTILGVAGAVLSPLLPTIIGLAGAFALVGVSVLAIGGGLLAAGTGLSALAVGFTALATAGAAGATAVVASLSVIVTGVAGLIPAVIEQFGYGLISLCRVIAGYECFFNGYKRYGC